MAVRVVSIGRGAGAASAGAAYLRLDGSAQVLVSGDRAGVQLQFKLDGTFVKNCSHLGTPVDLVDESSRRVIWSSRTRVWGRAFTANQISAIGEIGNWHVSRRTSDTAMMGNYADL